jgi:hypothetical protein
MWEKVDDEAAAAARGERGLRFGTRGFRVPLARWSAMLREPSSFWLPGPGGAALFFFAKRRRHLSKRIARLLESIQKNKRVEFEAQWAQKKCACPVRCSILNFQTIMIEL